MYVVDRVPERLAKAKEIGCTPIDFSAGDAVDQILKLRGGVEIDRGVDGTLCFSFPLRRPADFFLKFPPTARD